MIDYEYVCIDFETANSNITSACSVGFVCAKNGKVVKEKYYLLNPEEEFLPGNIMIHGITSDMVKDAPKIYEVWDEIYDIINDTVLVAHSAGFDMGVLKSLIDKYNLKYPNIRIADTLSLSRIAFKGAIFNNKLNTISNYLEVNHNHHNALSDAYVCYYIIERCKRMYQVYDIYDLYETVNLYLGILKQKVYNGCKQKVTKIIKNTKTESLKGLIFGYSGKPKAFTKTEFKKLVEENGGLLSKDISMVINAFVIFTNPTKENMNALKIIQSKKSILVLYEQEFLELIYGKRI